MAQSEKSAPRRASGKRKHSRRGKKGRRPVLRRPVQMTGGMIDSDGKKDQLRQKLARRMSLQ